MARAGSHAALDSGGLLALTFFVAVFGLALLLAGPVSAGGAPEYIAGDFLVGTGETQVMENRTLVISGNVTVATGGSLELRNSSLLLDLTSNGSLIVTVESGAVLRVLDLDGSPQTLLDRSEIAPADPSLRYLVRFLAGSTVTVRNSVLSGFGYSLTTPGMLIESDAVSFSGATLQAYAYVRVENASPQFVGTTFVAEGIGSNYFFGSSSLLVNCTLDRHFVALSASNASNLTVVGALIRDSSFSLAVNGARLAFTGSTVNNSSSGIFLTNAASIESLDSVFDPAAVTLGDANSTLVVRRSFVVLALNQASEPARAARVSFFNATGAVVSAGDADDAGEFGPTVLLAYTHTAAGRVDEANYTATATKSGNSTGYNFSASTEASPITLLLPSNLDPRLTLISPAPGAILLASLDVVFEANATDPDGPPEGVYLTWTSSIQGLLGTGGADVALVVPLLAGNHTIAVEGRDRLGGLRTLLFPVVVEPGRLEVYRVALPSGNATVAVWKASPGGLVVFRSPPIQPPLLAVGDALEVHPSSGLIEWGWMEIAMPYNPTDVPYGALETGLAVYRFQSGVWAPVPGPVPTTDIVNRMVTVNISRSDGLGVFLLVAQKGPNLPPVIETVPRLVALRLATFTFRITARDTPGDPITFSLLGAPVWLSIDSATGLLSGFPGATDRGLYTATVLASDGAGANATARLEVFVTGSLDNRAPTLVNPQFLPAHPVVGDLVSIQATYYDPDDDLPVLLEVVIDGTPHSMEPVNLFDINVTDGKDYVFRTTLSAGHHTIIFRVNDGYAGHADLSPIDTTLDVSPDSLRQLDSWFLALFASVALMLVLMVYFAATAKPQPKRPKEPEDEVKFLEGEAVTPIERQAKVAKAGPDREDELEREAEALAQEAAQDEREAKEEVDEAEGH